MSDQIQTIENLKTIKDYYGDLANFLIQRQSKSRLDSLEHAFVTELENFLAFWHKIMEDFKDTAQNELEKVLQGNEELKKELFELLESVLGFRPPPDSLFLQLLAARKIAVKLKTNEAVKFLNFDFYKKHNIKINENWVRDRKLLIIKKIKHFESKLAVAVEILKGKLNKELWRLHCKRLKQFDRLMVKYMKLKNSIYEINAKESYQIKKLKQIFLIRNDVPNFAYNNDDNENASLMDEEISVMSPKNKNILPDHLDISQISQKTVPKMPIGPFIAINIMCFFFFLKF